MWRRGYSRLTFPRVTHMSAGNRDRAFLPGRDASDQQRPGRGRDGEGTLMLTRLGLDPAPSRQHGHLESRAEPGRGDRPRASR